MLERIKEVIVKEIGINGDDITLDSHLTHDLGIESMDFYCLLESLEDEFKIKIPEEDGIATVKDVIDMIEKLMQ